MRFYLLEFFLQFIFGLTYIDGCRLGYASAFVLSSFFLPQELWLSLVIWYANEKRHMIFDYNVNGTT